MGKGILRQLALGLLMLGCGRDNRKLLAPGDEAPDVDGILPTGELEKLSNSLDRGAIVYFYPKDETPGCTKEACAFRDSFARFRQEKIALFGVSRDSAKSHRGFQDHHQIPFPLVSDSDGSIVKSYGVPERLPGFPSRVTFLVDKHRKIVRVWPNVDPAIHAEEVLAEIKKLP